jgi:integrase
MLEAVMVFGRVQVEKGIRQVGPDRWEVQVHVGRDPITGKLRQVSRTTRKGIADARRLRAKLVTEVAQGKHGGTVATLGSVLDQWLAHIERDGRSPKTLAEYRRKIDRVIRPGLGAKRLDKLSVHDLDAWYGSLVASGTSPATVMHYHRIIAAALHQGERWGWVERNVARLAKPPRVDRVELTIPPPERVRSLIDLAAASKAPEMATIITIAALTGLRRGELCGLRWSDIDWDGFALTVRRSIWQTSKEWGAKLPKSHQVRRLVLDEVAMSVLAGRWSRVSETIRVAEVPLVSEAYVFSSDVGGERPMMPNTITRAFSLLCDRMEILAAKADPPHVQSWPYRFHDLRHYTATELFRAGHNPRTVADRLGHADAALTLRVYTHDTEDRARAAAAALGAGLAGSG